MLIMCCVFKASKRIYPLMQLRIAGVRGDELCSLYVTCIQSLIEYAYEVCHFNLPEYLSNQLQTEHSTRYSCNNALEISGLPTVKCRRNSLCKKIFKSISCKSHKLNHLLPSETEPRYNLRQCRAFCQPLMKTARAKLF